LIGEKLLLKMSCRSHLEETDVLGEFISKKGQNSRFGVFSYLPKNTKKIYYFVKYHVQYVF